MLFFQVSDENFFLHDFESGVTKKVVSSNQDITWLGERESNLLCIREDDAGIVLIDFKMEQWFENIEKFFFNRVIDIFTLVC